MGGGLQVAREMGDKQGVAVSLNAMAVNTRDRGDVEVAHTLFEESLLLWKELGDQKAVARALSNLGSVVKSRGDYARARSLYGECLAIFAGLGDRTGVAWSLNHQGDAAREQGDLRGRRGHCTSRRSRFSGSSATAGGLPGRWRIWERWRASRVIARRRSLCIAKA